MQYLGAVSKITEWSVCFQGKPFDITVIQIYAPTTKAKEAQVEQVYEDLQDLLELTPKKMSFSFLQDVLFIVRDWNAKEGNQEIPGVIGKLGLRVQNETGQSFAKRMYWS